MPLRTLWLPYCSWLLSQIYQVSNWQNSLSLCHQKLSHVLAWYEKYPPDQNFRDGYNLYVRLRDYQDDHLYFLSHPEIDYTNNISERQLRKFKRKQNRLLCFGVIPEDSIFAMPLQSSKPQKCKTVMYMMLWNLLL